MHEGSAWAVSRAMPLAVVGRQRLRGWNTRAIQRLLLFSAGTADRRTKVRRSRCFEERNTTTQYSFTG